LLQYLSGPTRGNPNSEFYRCTTRSSSARECRGWRPAFALAYYDQRVCILERHYTIGGLNSFYRLRGRDYDVGLHAVTNFTPKGAKRGPLARLLRQLRFRWEDFALAPQIGSAIAFPGVELKFGNDIRLLEARSPRLSHEKDNFQQLLRELVDYDDLQQEHFNMSAREVLGRDASRPAADRDAAVPADVVRKPARARHGRSASSASCSAAFSSKASRGLSRRAADPAEPGAKRFRRSAANCGCAAASTGSSSRTAAPRAWCWTTASRCGPPDLSSAGLVETMRLCEDITQRRTDLAGQLSFVESISILDRQPAELGHDRTIVFYNDSDKFHWQTPREGLCDVRTGVICSPNNYAYDPSDGQLPDGVIRITALATSTVGRR
jgi:hypothetical protein